MQRLSQRLIRWAVIVVLVLIIPLVLTLTGSGVDGVGWHWTFFDFVFMGILLFGSALTYELVARKMKNTGYRVAVGFAVVTGLLLIYSNAAVGIIGGDHPANLMYIGVIAVGLLGAFIARFQPQGMIRALLATAVAQVLVAFIALVVRQATIISDGHGIVKFLLINVFFTALWFGSALLFRRAALSDHRSNKQP